ncbi:hypothetical protein ACWCYZ_05425 [Streptomyces virginiae]
MAKLSGHGGGVANAVAEHRFFRQQREAVAAFVENARAFDSGFRC